MFDQLMQFAEMIGLIYQEKEELKKQFNPNNEPIWILKVVEKTNMKRMRPWIGAYRIDRVKTAEYGSRQYEKVPPTPQTITLSEKDKQTSGRHDVINYVDPEMIDPETNLPMFRAFRRGEIFLAVDTNASWMVDQEYVVIMPNLKNIKNEETGKLIFEWAEENEIMSDEKAILIPKYHERYSKDATSIMSIAQRLLNAEMEIQKLKDERGK